VECPEILFRPSIINSKFGGIHELIKSSIQKCDVEMRKDFTSNLVITGGTSMFPGLIERLNQELKQVFPKNIQPKIVAPPERKYQAWLGGSILASLNTFQTMWIGKNEYDECGAQIVHKKCF